MPPKEPKDGSHHHKFFSLRGKKKDNRVKKGLSGALGASLGAIGFRPEDDENSSVSSKSSVQHSLQHQASRDSLKSIDMSLFNHLKRNKQDKHGSSNHVEPPREVPRIVTTTDAPSIVNRDFLKPKMSRPKTQDRTVSEASGFSAASDATAVPDESRTRNRSSILERAKAVVTSRSASPSPSTSPDATNRKQLGPRGNHIVTDAVASFRPKLAAELKGYKEAELAAGVSSENLFGFIANERLRRMPARGSRWDKILKWAEDFAKKLSLFEVTDDRFIPSSKDAVELILASIQILLMLGPQNGEALERAFGIFHEYGLTFDFYKRNISMLVSISEARRYLSLSLADMLGLSVEMSILYRKSSRSMSSASVTVNFNLTFGHRMESFVSHKDRIAELMWTWQLENSSEISGIHVSIESIRQWLLPQDRQLQALVAGRRSTRTPRAEFTCEWLDRPLVDFARSRDRVFTITAEAGAGKSFLFDWILERLQRRVGHHEYQAISASVDSQVPAQATQIALVKTLLLQLLEQNVGNVALFRCLANVTELDANTDSSDDAEDALWYTLDTALQGLENVVLVIDGLDSLEGDEAHKLEAFEHLHDIATKNKHNVRVILLSRPLSTPWPKPTRQVVMTSQRTTQDVKHMARAWLVRRGLGNKQEIEDISQQIAIRSKGSLTWADMSLRLLSKATTIAEVTTAVKELPSTTNEILAKHVSSITLSGDARLIISWLLVSKRPLSTVEIQALLELQVQKGLHQPRSTNIIEDIKNACGSLVIIQDKTVRFRNESIRLHLLELSKKETKDAENALLSPDEANKDLTARLLLYVKICVTRNVESSLDTISSIEVDSLFKSHALLEYATRNWLSHFKRSNFYAGGQVQAPAVTAQLKGVFPNSTLLARLEQRCWDKQTLAKKANASHVLALTVRQTALGDSAQCVLQSCINVAQSYKKLSAPADASKYFYKAAKIGQTVLGRTNELAVACAIKSLDISATIKEKATARNDAVTQREELLQYVIDTEKQRGGAHSALASKYNNELAELYTSIKENEKAEAVYRSVYKTSIAQNGQFSAEASAAAEKLQTVLYKEAKHEEVVQYTQPIFEAAERNLDIFDIRRVEITLRMADTYETKKDYTHAEELYISLWRGLTEYCRSTSVTATAAQIAEAHQRKIQISIAYARFLRRQGREAEAQNILHGVWLDYQNMTEHKSEAVVNQLNEVGEELKSMGILDSAIAVFKSVWGYFKGSGKQTSTAAVNTAVSLMGAVQEKAEKKKVEAAKAKAAITAKGGVRIEASIDSDVDSDESDVEDDEADAILDEVVKAAVSAPAAARPESKTREVAVVTIESQIQTCDTLSSFYLDKKKWTECIEVCSQLLKQIWPDLGSSGKYGFPNAHRDVAIKFTRRLALAYTESNQTESAEKLYTAIFQCSLFSGLKIQDEFVTESANQLIEFHKKTQQWSKVLAVYQQLLEGYKTSLGSRNPLTIRTLYIMGDLCVQYRIKGADRYYLELVRADKNAEGVISKDALPAAIALSKIYYEQKRWAELRPIYAAMWLTFTKKAKEYNMSPELVQTIYKRYIIVLQTHLKVPVEEVRKVAIEYRDTCTQVYGPQADVTLSASMALVAISRKSNNVQYQQEAVKICEEVVAESEKQKAATAEGGKAVDTKKSAFQLSLIASAKRHLAGLYSAQTQVNGSAATGAAGEAKAVVSAESAQKAEVLWKEQLEVNKKEYGCAHKATLGSLASLVGVWARSDKPEVRKQAQAKLDTSVVEVLSESCVAGKASVDSTKLHESGAALAKTYLSCGFSVQAWALLKQLRFHVVARGKIAGSVSIEKVANVELTDNIDRRAMVFIAAFEETLRTAQTESANVNASKTVIKYTFSDIMTDLLTEGILYDRYSLSMASKVLSVEHKMFDGARLYVFLKLNKEQHAEQLVAVEESLFKLFMEKFGASIKTETIITRAFMIAIIEELGQLRLHEDNILFVTCTAVTARVHALLLADSYAQAVGLATAWYQFMTSQNGFKNAKTIPFAFKLSLYLAGLGVKSTKAADAIMQNRMLELSKTILRETLMACKSMNIDLVQLQASELNSLVRLMGQQKNYEDLEWLLTQLWNSRIIQASWSATTVIAVGRRLVEVLFVRGKRDQAISLAESMAYNLRRTWGLLDAATVDMNNLLSALCVADQRYADALDVHEEILRALLDINMAKDDDDDFDDAASELMDFEDENAAALALQQLELVRRIYARNAGWPETDELDMVQLTTDVVAEFAPLAPDAYAPFGDGDSSKWSRNAPSAHDTTGTFVAPSVWEFSLSEEVKPGQPALRKMPSHMLRSLQLSRQRSYGDLSEARKRLGEDGSKSGPNGVVGGGVNGNALLAAPVH
ncbi:hypothetical protein VSDG_05608 [Cytospora chrysosperma]|uniref:Nephrocystin 3-like N-terminal domain-containing protein n=1 Tax=Cytospora chrysosperma TaxID=252740 RepID=A0A423VZV9_CYTCH|nr:hypothetical protein VSDG_05608 [Valsa sordida]